MHAGELPELSNNHETSLDAGHNERRTRWVVGVTAVMMLVELTVGSFTGSIALVADGWHMATHVGALGLAAAAYAFARSRAGHRSFTFGTGKVYALAGYTSAVALALVAVFMAGESVRRLASPVAIHFAEALPVAVLGLLVNLLSLKLLHHEDAHDDDHVGHQHHDHNLRAAYVHVLADALTSVLAIVALLAGRYAGWTFLDPAMGMVGAAVILKWAWGLCGGAARQLLDACPSPHDEDRIRAVLEDIDDVRVIDLHLWEMGPGRRGCIAAIVSSRPKDATVYRAEVRAAVDLAHLTIEIHRCTEGHARGVG